ncbi:MAG: recombinase family protein, partial [Oscillospiraceae bacterium]|nr:recombinase family protein [Oscillospiraceae bacterium]
SRVDQQLQVAAYCRVSTRHEEQLRSWAAQSSYYTSCSQNHPNWVLISVYSEAASGIRTNQRPGYQKLVRDCASRKVGLIRRI